MTARTIALSLGISYVLLTALELAIDQWTLGDTDVLLRTTKANLVHWGVALTLLGASFSGLEAARVASRIAGFFLLGIGVWGFLAPASLGDFLGFSGEIPLVYNVFHSLTAGASLVGGFALARRVA